MKMTNFKSLPNVFGIFLGLIMVCLFAVSAELKAQTAYGLPLLKPKAEITQIADAQILVLQEELKLTCTSQDPTAPCVRRIYVLLDAYSALNSYIQGQPWMDEYEMTRAIYPVTNRFNLTVSSAAVNMDGFSNQQYNPYFTEILLRIKS